MAFLQLSAQHSELPSFPPNRASIDLFEDQQMIADGGCSLACAISWELSATSTLQSEGSNNYEVSMLEDGQRSTAWVEGVKGDGVGQRITMTFLRPDGADEAGDEAIKIPFHGILLTNGYAKTPEVWSRNGRVKKLLVWLNSQRMCYLDLDDDIYPQEFLWTPNLVMVGEGDVISLEIVEVYPGSRYEDTAISDLGFYGAH